MHCSESPAAPGFANVLCICIRPTRGGFNSVYYYISSIIDIGELAEVEGREDDIPCFRWGGSVEAERKEIQRLTVTWHVYHNFRSRVSSISVAQCTI